MLRLPAAPPAALRYLRLAVPRVGSLFAPRRGEPACLALDGATIVTNTDGWPTIDTDTAVQDTASELYALIMSGGVPSDWGKTESASDEAGTATYCLAGGGGGNFTYNGTAGTVTLTGTCP